MSHLLLKTALAALVRAASVFIAFLLTAVVTQVLGAEEAGFFLLGFTLLTVLSSFLRLGLDNVLIRAIGSDDLAESAQYKVNLGLRWVLLATVSVAVLGVTFASMIANDIFGKPGFTLVLIWVMAALPAVTLFNLLSFAFQGQQRVVMATLFQNLAQGALFVTIFALIAWQLPRWLTASGAAFLYSLVSIFVLGLAVWCWFRQPGVQFYPPSLMKIADAELWLSSSNLWMVISMALLVQWSGVLVAGIFVDASELAYLSAAQRTAGVTSFILVVVNMTVAPRYARLWKESNLQEMRRLARVSTRTMIVLMLPIMVVMLCWPDWVMKLFGPGFEQGAVLLTIMAIGQFVNVATGSVGYLLNMSGHERDLKRVTLFSGPLTIVCAVLFTYKFGVLGAAWATALGASVQSLLAMLMVKRRLGFWPIG
ncbi:oligosaccharide flippase family protein [Candidatus Thalassolituus haligoni]|jgi:O-antigen/teichoic acid export membrane protein|uniref:oligosaccharide flippase family protein n=1 Tax=Candidatus Thalassolituus haligoni TaxID=3100113 RepID=UPI003512DEAE